MFGPSLSRRPSQRETSVSVHLPAPVGGWNASDAVSAMAPSDCVYLYNMIPFQHGLRTRLGYREWATNVSVSSPWLPLTLYVPGAIVTNDGGKVYIAVTNGLSAASGGPTGTGSGIVDGTVTWNYSGTTGSTSLSAKTLLSFSGAESRNNKLFACTTSGIYDITN